MSLFYAKRTGVNNLKFVIGFNTVKFFLFIPCPSLIVLSYSDFSVLLYTNTFFCRSDSYKNSEQTKWDSKHWSEIFFNYCAQIYIDCA